MILLLCLALVAVGIYGVLSNTNVVKIVLSLLVVEHGVRLMLVVVGYRSDGVPPIVVAGSDPALLSATAVDPLPQALVLTSIVIGLSVLALLVALCVRLYERFGTFDVTEMRRLRG
ncbi:MAG: NADH-quinone oxidoreductase subunit K [Myxococcota bacterium]|nr:NADH-quinone oxidoreductase subunit K [Myxococcota bacterium]